MMIMNNNSNNNRHEQVSHEQPEQKSPDASEIKQAVNNANADQIAKNLAMDATTQSNQATELSDEQKTPFIDQSVRTDK